MEEATFNILSSCIITLVLCLYTCLHVDIPEHGKTHWTHVLRRKALWVIPGLFAPELVSSFYVKCDMTKRLVR